MSIYKKLSKDLFDYKFYEKINIWNSGYSYNNKYLLYFFYFFYKNILNYFKFFFLKKSKIDYRNKKIFYLGSSRHYIDLDKKFISENDIVFVSDIIRNSIYKNKNVNYINPLYNITAILIASISYHLFLLKLFCSGKKVNRSLFLRTHVSIVSNFIWLKFNKPDSILVRCYERLEFNSFAYNCNIVSKKIFLYPHAYSPIYLTNFNYTKIFTLGKFQSNKLKDANSKTLNLEILGKKNIPKINHKLNVKYDFTILKNLGFSNSQVTSIVLFLKNNYLGSEIILRSHPGSDDSALAKELDIYFDDGNMPINTFLQNSKICISKESNVFLDSSFSGCLNLECKNFFNEDNYEFLKNDLIILFELDNKNILDEILSKRKALLINQLKAANNYILQNYDFEKRLINWIS